MNYGTYGNILGKLAREKQESSDIPSDTKSVKHGWQGDHVHDGGMRL